MEKITDEWISFLEKTHRISSEVWKKYKLHFDEKYLYIPYCDTEGNILFEKKRCLPTSTRGPKYIYPSGCKLTLYPLQDIAALNELVLTEGELDALTLISYGIPAATSGGATSFTSKFIPYLKNKKIYICFDTDSAGKSAAEKTIALLINSGINAHLIQLPDNENIKDIGDYFNAGYTKEEFLELKSQAGERTYTNKEGDNISQASGTETPLDMPEVSLLENKLTYKEVEEKALKYLPDSCTALKILLAVALSGNFESQLMLWILFVGVPSSGKTNLVRLLRDAPTTYYLDSLTQNAFISGEREKKNEKVHDLLAHLDKKCLIVKDWTSIFSHDEKITKKILGDLVGIYDKEFSKFSSRRGRIIYKSNFSQIGCITPFTLNKHTQYMNMVGPRFLSYIMPQLSEEKKEQSFKSIFNGGNISLLEDEARLYVSSYLHQLTCEKLPDINLSADVQKYLRLSAELLSHCRGAILTQQESYINSENKLITYYAIQDVQIEEPWRALQQLILLTKYLAIVQQKDNITCEDLAIVKEIVISSMPSNKAQALRIIMNYKGLIDGVITANELSKETEKSSKTSRRLLVELHGLKILKKVPGSGTNHHDYEIEDKYKDFLLTSPAEFLSNNKAVQDNLI